MKLNHIIGYAISFLWFLLGMVTYASIVWNIDGLMVNLIIGSISLFVGFIFLKRTQGFAKFCRSNSVSDRNAKSFKIYDQIMLILILLFVSLLAAMAIYRTLSERMSVFG